MQDSTNFFVMNRCEQLILIRLHTIKNMIILSSGDTIPEGGKENEKVGHLFAFGTGRVERSDA